MKEALSDEYFIDGFFIKHFKRFPVGVNQEDFFEEQKIFVMYLCGVIPEFTDWNFQIKYYQQKAEIEDMTISDVKLDESELDIAKFRNEDVNKIKEDKLKTEKKRRILELNKEFGVKNKEAEKKVIEVNNEEKENSVEDKRKEQQRLYDILQGKGLTKQNG